MKIRDLQQEYIRQLSNLYARDEAATIFAEFTMHHLRLDRGGYLLALGSHADADFIDLARRALTRLAGGSPLQQLTGQAHFYGLEFTVNEHVLIPRPETEELVDWAIKTVAEKTQDGSGLSVMDFCTGSGCIAVVLKHKLPAAAVSALDISEAALKVARGNASRYQTNIRFLCADVLAYETGQPFDVMISNPPYIPDADRSSLHINVLMHEPELALFVPDNDALVFYKAIAAIAAQDLKKGGYLFFEINPDYSGELLEHLTLSGFSHVELRQDMHGKDRMIRARK
ncbi:peptide chain release factor N(5)-glutamine methyltransferase [Pedobacter yulinensis]|uniref:peptide chain release factor N(5)-glutamine methyltransferase n=1 Tax=Pedobacter yulinensis TaxID=2126353 RepID=A0A2T3HKR4_9SPHI|nr:peptide chain release factor N(5)-glutamine methyltransferase [Pedobacter yulinensis]PST83042.1 peptide chain release factor N(5)-glutamine methyltransferase [Pedobacter yulinensis]